MPEFQSLNIGVCVIATRKYKQFVYNLICGIGKNFLPNHRRTVFLFTDEIIPMEFNIPNLEVIQLKILSYPFPFATLYRYRIISFYRKEFKNMDYIAYTDADMDFVDAVGEEVLGSDLTFVYHPGFFSKNDVIGHWGSNGVSADSLAYVQPKDRSGYVAGGFNMGKAYQFLRMAQVLSSRINDDESRGVIAEHNDESHTNFYVKYCTADMSIQWLSPEYCMVEQLHLRQAWGINNLKPRIIALSKDHKSIRE